MMSTAQLGYSNYSNPNVAPAPVNGQPFGSLQEAGSRVRDEIFRLERLADQLCGSVPQPVEDSKQGSIGGGGLFGGVSQIASDLHTLASRADTALARIYARLPEISV